ncbi:hypothetical protein PILCRDRAFT_79445 [Piloderma croceum F 1598]|uniref:Uncharacterized protein n=1 Tax=Piloderma croceum (strain F 1598) TaxID=765440 RepID=A0A0C3AM55_PILCF|nr:hypothetical protein PILCRDRAFT_79445 [Piloderma croceum F 1598]
MPISSYESTYIDARNSTIIHAGRDHITYANQTAEAKEILGRLKPVERGYYYVPPCMKGTREEIFEEINQWLIDIDAPNILWLSGSPGAGKSTIASSLVSKLTERCQLGSHFFFKRGDVALSDPASVWRTVASDLAQFDLSFANNLVQVLEAQKVNPGIADITLHFRYLIAEPLMKSYDPSSHTIPVIVIDALDECDGGSQTTQRRAFMDTLTEWSRLPKIFKIITTGRNEHIPGSFCAVCKQLTLPTGDDVSVSANRDIFCFFEAHFAELGGSLFPEWPGKHVLDALTARAAGLFIWAETAMKVILQGLPTEQLDLVLAGDLGEEDNITKLYRQILESSFGGVKGHTLDVFRLVMSTIILAKGALCIDDLCQIVLQPKSSVAFILNKLSSVISIRGTDQHLHITHLSFTEFLCSKQCPQKFYIDCGRESHTFVTACFQIMKAGLKFNICDLATSHLLNDSVTNLPQQIAAKISRPLLYSCSFWGSHLTDATIDLAGHAALLNMVKDFLHVQLLFWLEVMSLTKKLSLANITLLSVANWLQVFDTDLAAFAEDCNRFIVTFDIPITESAPHIYLSALPFAPPESLISKQYLKQFKNRLIVSGGEQEWPACTKIFRGHYDGVTSVAFSPNGGQVVSGSFDKTICVWDVETGQTVVGPLKGHADSVESVAFSPDGKQVVSGSHDHTVCVWSITSGQMIMSPFEGHTDCVKSVAFSPNGKWVVSGSADCTVRVWDIKTGQTIAGPFEGHADYISSVAFSLDSKWVVSGSYDCTVCVWNVETGQTVAGPFKSQKFHVKSVAFMPDSKQVIVGFYNGTVCVWNVETSQTTTVNSFKGYAGYTKPVTLSPDGKWIVSVSYDHKIYVWDVESGQTITDPLEGHIASINSAAFSLNGKQLVSGANDNTIHVWDVEIRQTIAGSFDIHNNWVNSVAFLPNGKVVSVAHDCTVSIWDVETGQIIAGPFEGHTDYIESVAFSLDGKQVVSGSDDCTIRVWDVETGQMIAGPFEDHEDYVETVAFSADGKCVVSGSHDCTVRVWDVETGQTITSPLIGHTASVNSVAFSPDGKLIVSGSRDHTVRVWNIEVAQTIAGPFDGHSRVNSVSFSPDGKLVVSGSHDHKIYVWNVQTGETIAAPFEGHTSFVTSVKFSPDGKLLVSGSQDKTVRVWEVETGQTIAGPFKGHRDKVNSVSFSPDGKQVVSGSNDCTAYVWDVHSIASSFEDHTHLAKSATFPPTSMAHQNMQLLHETANIHKPVSIGGRCMIHNCTDGWVHSKWDIECGGHLFWAPIQCRAALHGAKHAISGIHTIQLNFDQFVHGTSWSQCYFS